MNEEHDMHATVDEGGEFDPTAAAKLLEQTTRRAQRQFEFPSPLLSLIQAAALLARMARSGCRCGGRIPTADRVALLWRSCTHSWPWRRSRSVWTAGAHGPG